MASICSSEYVNNHDRPAFEVVQGQLTWYEAREACESINAHLAEIRSDEDNSYVVAMLPPEAESVWIGANDIYNENTFVYVNGGQVTYADWSPGQPDDYRRNEDCVEIRPAYEVVQGQLTWYEAREACESINAHLAEIRSDEDNSYVVAMLPPEAESVWIGANDIYNENSFVYVNGGQVTYADWSPGQPDDYRRNEDCVEIRNIHGWNDLPCTLRPWGYVCENYITTCNIPPPGLNTEWPSCSDGVYYGSVCRYTCIDGYEPATSMVILCYRSGQWNNTSIQCNITTCDMPPPGLNTEWPSCSDGVYYGSECRYTCIDGYEPATSMVILCDRSGQWNHTSIQCNITTCDIPPPGSNTEWPSCSDGVNYGSECRYTCTDEYEPVTSMVTLCEKSGLWNHNNVICNSILACVGAVCLAIGFGVGMIVGCLKYLNYKKTHSMAVDKNNVTEENAYATINLNDIVTNVYETVQKEPIYQNK
ncbi:L-selectin-like [Saccoglossus kowalevskii]